VATDKRVERSKDAVLTETYRLLTEGGIGGVSIDEVSRRSGVAKTTIYRHWPSRSALLLDACSRLGTATPTPDSGRFVSDIRELTEALAGQLASARWASILPSIIDAAERDEDVARLQAALHAQMMVPFAEVIDRALGRGELEPNRSSAHVVAAIVGPLFYRRWFSKEPIDHAFIEDVLRYI
jgi:AcrR family transcriptional regulator